MLDVGGREPGRTVVSVRVSEIGKRKAGKEGQRGKDGR